jgi:hypothetical protein
MPNDNGTTGVAPKEKYQGSTEERAPHPYLQGGTSGKTVRDEAAGLRHGPGTEPPWVKKLIEPE